MNLTRLHYYSGIIISIFISLHLFNHITGIQGAEVHISVMNFLRLLYRNILAEIILLMAIGIQIFSGLQLAFRKRKSAKTFFEKLHIGTGLYLSFFFLAHLTAVMGGRYYLKLDTNYYFGAAAINTFPFTFIFVIYYTLAIMSFFGHIASVHLQKMKRNIYGFKPFQQSIVILIFGILITVLVFSGMTNRFKGVNIPKEYGVLVGKPGSSK